MRIGIVTFHRVLNYGAVLQTYALQQTLLDLGIDCKIIDYRKEEFENEYRNLKFNQLSLDGFLNTIKCWMVRKKDQTFINFFKENYKLSKPCYTKSDLAKVSKNFDVLLTGSDQVFNYYTTNKDENYFLNFSNAKSKYSYAASFGFNTFDSKYDDFLKQSLSDFNEISVREIGAKEYLEKLLKRNVYLHCDPSFMLTKKDWEKFVLDKTIKKYVLIYSVKKSKSLLNIAMKLSKAYNLDIIYIKYTYEYCGGVKVMTKVSPESFINLIYHAEFVVTNLFHGVAFSMILEKLFYVCIQDTVNTNSRLTNLLYYYNLKDRIVNTKDELEVAKIDYAKINKKISIEREKSKEYLKNLRSKYNEM